MKIQQEQASKTVNPADIEKFMSMEQGKRDRIINAAMYEFSYGYKKASTDAIVKKAEISKGLLFHYFGSKEQLFAFLVNYALELVTSEYKDLVNIEQRDLLEGIWQMALLKRDLTDRYPSIYDFMQSLYIHRSDFPTEEAFLIICQKHEDILNEYYRQCDTSLFIDDIEPKKVINLILWAINGFLEEEEVKYQVYEDFLEDLRSYLDIFRLRFYRAEK